MLLSIHSVDGGRSTQSDNTVNWLSTFLYDAIRRGNGELAIQLLFDFLRVRKQTTGPSPAVVPVKLGAAPDEPAFQLYCVPALAAPSTYLQYAKLAPYFKQIASVWTADNKGFGKDQPLADGPAGLMSHHLDAIAKCRTEIPLVVLGYSSGGWLAAQIAHELEQTGAPAAGVVLLDTVLPPSGGLSSEMVTPYVLRNIELQLSGRSVHSEAELMYQLTSMLDAFSTYAAASWSAPKYSTPTLFVEAAVDVVHDAAGFTIISRPEENWKPSLPQLDIRPVQCDHYDLIATNVDSTSAVILEWLRTKLM
jgi:thioesterase domain-containing protein